MIHVEFSHEEKGKIIMVPCECTMIKLVHHKDLLLYRCRVSKNPKEDKFYQAGYFYISDIWVTDDWLHTRGRWIYNV